MGIWAYPCDKKSNLILSYPINQDAMNQWMKLSIKDNNNKYKKIKKIYFKYMLFFVVFFFYLGNKSYAFDFN